MGVFSWVICEFVVWWLCSGVPRQTGRYCVQGQESSGKVIGAQESSGDARELQEGSWKVRRAQESSGELM